MKKVFSLLLSLTMVMALLAGCGGDTTADDTTDDTASNDAAQEETAELSGTVATDGSTSMEEVIGALGEQFMADNSGVSVTYNPTGSGAGIEAVSNGSCDIGLASRALTDDEKAGGLTETIVALDGIAVIVNAENPVSDLTLEQIASIYTGAVTDWSEFGSDAGAIAVIGRESGSGTRDGFESITGTEDQCVLAQELSSTGAVIEAVRTTPGAIGYASLSAVQDQKDITVLTVGGVAPSEATVLDGSYAIQRPFVFATRTDEALSDAAQAFFDFATSTAASDLIANAGAVPREYEEASLALGATHIETVFRVSVPAARSGIATAIVLGIGRAIGEAMAIIMVAGNVANMPGLLTPVRFLTTAIASEMSYASVGSLHRNALFSIGLVLFLFIMLINVFLNVFIKRKKED